MINKNLFLILIFLGILFHPAPALAVAPGWLHTEGRLVKDSQGDVATLGGVNMFVCLQNEPEKFAQAKAMGAQVVRLMLWKNAIENPSGLAINDPCFGQGGVAAIDKAIEYASNAGLRVILEHQIWSYQLAPAPANFWIDPVLQASWLDMWKLLVARYKDNPTVIGVDLMNEPYSISILHGSVTPDPQGAWEAIAENAVNELRPLNPNLLFMIEGWGPRTNPSWRDLPFLQQPNTIYSDHIYYTGRTYDWATAYQSGNFAQGRTLFQSMVSDRYGRYLNAGVPVWIGEVGFLTTDPGWETQMRDELEILEGFRIDYSVFVYGVSRWNLSYDIVNSTYTLTAVGQIVSERLKNLIYPPATPTPSVPRTYYVSPSGNDNNPGTPSQPWQTIQKAANTMIAGDSVNVLAGSYSETHIDIDHSGGTFLAQEGAIITGQIDIGGSSNIINGFEITSPAGDWGIQVRGTGNLVENNDIHNTMQDGITFYGDNNIIRGNYIHDLVETSTHVDFFQTSGPASNIIFEGNLCINPNTTGNNQIAMVESRSDNTIDNLIFRNNIFVINDPGTGQLNFHRHTELGEGVISNITVVNNTFVHLSGMGYESIWMINITTGVVKNNLIVNWGDSTHSYILVSGISSGIDISNNAIYKTSCCAPMGDPYPDDIWMQDPKLVNFAGLDFHLLGTSLVIDKGIDSAVNTDFDGMPRPQGAGFDIGAYEFVINSPSPTPSPPPPPETDLDSDQDTDFLDLILLILGFGVGGLADFNHTGLVDLFDFNALIQDIIN
ncbi:hypothetical protein A2W24_06695 [Microgenomates group bacterium RBG_16_45_19]|nr:MAG: hypothetical protein A2W24_06695 [Microgenomates group bacterium RBG_16_45_19]